MAVRLPGGSTTTFKYDPFGRRIQKGSSIYVYDGSNLIQESDSAGNLIARYIHGPGIDAPLAGYRGSTSEFYEADALGSITSFTNTSGVINQTYVYDSFGNTSSTTGTFVQPFRYAGREFDTETGLLYYRARFYDPAIGRFISEDPVGFVAGGNFYAYVLNRPTNFRDPSGMDIAVIENGPTSGNPFGHTALAITGEGVYSFGNGYFPGRSLEDYLLRESPRRDTVVYIIHTTPAQDAAALAYLKSKIGKPLGGVLKDNCSTRSNNALDAAGIPRLGPRIPGAVNLPTDTLDELGITPGSAGARAAAAGATAVPIPKGTTTIPGSLNQFEPPPYPY
jgi:RHS repeat-associated protein